MASFFFQQILNLSVFAIVFKLVAPVILAAIGGLFCGKVGVMNIGLEGAMLVSAFFSIVVNAMSGSWILGILAGCAASIFLCLMLAFFTFKYKAHHIVTGFAINTFASAMTIFLLQTFFGSSGSYQPEKVAMIPVVNIPVIENIPVLSVISGHSLIVWMAFFSVVLCSLIFYKTPYGAHLIAVGENVQAARSVGIDEMKIKYSAFVICGILCGIGGAFLSTGATSMFVRDMTAGNGFIALAVISLGNARPYGVLRGGLIFGFANAIAILIETYPGLSVPSQFIQAIPYAVTILMLTVHMLQNSRRMLAPAKG
ncbi:MAG: ABC transporter permease [Lachnospiraceae bacterium]|nr:ABC transporter permease [Lachnospiraceae bacterium]MDE7332822.1 ABC transporter permease [Lachnospiraceae bacterium]